MKLEEPIVNLVNWIVSYIASNLDVTTSSIDAHSNFHDLGVDSVLGSELVFALSEHVSVELDPTVIFDCRNIRGLAEHVHALGIGA